MSERQPARRVDTDRSTAWVRNKILLGIDLGDLRAVVEASEGMPDEAIVSVGDLRRSALYVDQWHMQYIEVRAEAPAGGGKP